MRKPIIAGNWKLNCTITEAINLINGLKRELSNVEGIDIVVCPPYTALSDASEILIGSDIKLGAQDVYWEEKGAFTGEVSPLMLKDIGCEYVIIGHSERRKYFHETNEMVNKKAKAAIKAGLLPIICVGETLDERKAKKTFGIVKNHTEGSLQGLSEEDMEKVIIAYEPVWAIGTGVNATPQQAQEAHSYIRKLLTDMFGKDVAQGIRIQYGGSVKPDNIKELIQKDDVDGALVGGASLAVESFSQIVKGAVT